MSEDKPPEDRHPKRRRPWKGDDPFRDDLEEQEAMEYDEEETTPVTPEEDEEGPRGHKNTGCQHRP